MIQGIEFRVQGLGFRVQGSGFRPGQEACDVGGDFQRQQEDVDEVESRYQVTSQVVRVDINVLGTFMM
jgi:hypothetical protein